MSGRRLQRPAPVSTSKYKLLGTSIVTTLATGSQTPCIFYETHNQLCELPAGQRIRFHKTIRLDGPPDRFLDAQNILADFDGSHIPVFIQSEILIKNPKVVAVQEILEAHGKGFEVKDLIEAKFPEGDFQRHLITYLRDMTRANKCCRGESLETRLMDAYVTGMREWCAEALDVFILQVERNLDSHIESCEAVKGQADEIALWSQCPIVGQAASHQEEALKSLVKKALEDNPKCREEWSEYKAEHLVTHKVAPPTSSASAGKFHTVLMRKELRFISWLLRKLSSDSFLHEASDIANTLRCFGGPCHLVNLIENMSLYPEDVAEYKRVKNSVQGADDTDLQEASKPSVTGRLDLPKSIRYMSDPLRILDGGSLIVDVMYEIPPFLQLGYGFVNHGDFKKKAIKKISELWRSQKSEEALAVMDKEFHDAEEFHEHLLGLLRTAMRSYACSPKPPSASTDSLAYYLNEFSTHLGQLLEANARALQVWCAQVHGILTEKLDNAIIEAYQSSTKKSKDLIKAVSEVEPTLTQGVNWLMDQIKPSLMYFLLPPEIPLECHPQMAKFRHSLYTLDWLVKNMPWDCFLYFRAHVAKLVREVDRGKEGFSFLVNVLESLSFTDSDVDEFKQYYAEMPELRASRYRKLYLSAKETRDRFLVS